MDDQGNERVAVTLFSELSSEHLILSAACRPEYTTLFKAAAPRWNSDFQWRAIDAHSEGADAQALQELLRGSFGGPQPTAAARRDDSAPASSYRWMWLALNGVRLKVDSRGRRGTRLKGESRFRLAIDAWDTAYFLDFENQPRSRVRRVLGRLVHWRFSMGHLGAS